MSDGTTPPLTIEDAEHQLVAEKNAQTNELSAIFCSINQIEMKDPSRIISEYLAYNPLILCMLREPRILTGNASHTREYHRTCEGPGLDGYSLRLITYYNEDGKPPGLALEYSYIPQKYEYKFFEHRWDEGDVLLILFSSRNRFSHNQRSHDALIDMLLREFAQWTQSHQQTI